MAKRFGKVKSYADWIKPKLVENALELLDKEIPKYKDQIRFVHLCFSTDPFMFRHNEVKDMTLRIIERLNKDNIKCTVLTKGVYPEDLINKARYGSNNEYGITLVSLSEDFKRKFEPFSSPYDDRIASLKRLHDAGLKTWVSMEPYPTPNLIEQNLTKILNKLSFVDKIVFGKLNYNVQTSLFKSNLFKNNAEFYEECAQTVINFCEERGIDYHIKYGTQKKDDKKTVSIFNKKLEPEIAVKV
jgi:DNA repair photolyase